MTRKIRLGAFLPGGGQHIASWRHPDQPADGAVSFDFHLQLAQEAERGLFDAYFPADGLFRTAYEGRTLRENLGLPFPVNRQAAARTAELAAE